MKPSDGTVTTEEREEILQFKEFLSKHPCGCLVSDEQLLACVRQAKELIETPNFLAEALRKKKAQPPKDRARLERLLLRQNKLTIEEWKEIVTLLDDRWPKGS